LQLNVHVIIRVDNRVMTVVAVLMWTTNQELSVSEIDRFKNHILD